MKQSTITIDVRMDQKNNPTSIGWAATDSSVKEMQQAKAMMLAFWDEKSKSMMHVDLWTTEMTVDEMAEFHFQMMSSMADTFSRATAHKEFVTLIKSAAKQFSEQYLELRKKEMSA
jgi:gliding motility-associated protein GldC